MQMSAVAMHMIDQNFDHFWVDRRMNTMPQVKDVSLAFAVALKHALDFFADFAFRAIQYTRIKVALQRHSVIGEGACIAQIDGPVDAHSITAGTRDIRQPHATY